MEKEIQNIIKHYKLLSILISLIMIIEGWRSSIGNFNYTFQYNLKTIYRNFKKDSSITSNKCLLNFSDFRRGVY